MHLQGNSNNYIKKDVSSISSINLEITKQIRDLSKDREKAKSRDNSRENFGMNKQKSM